MLPDVIQHIAATTRITDADARHLLAALAVAEIAAFGLGVTTGSVTETVVILATGAEIHTRYLQHRIDAAVPQLIDADALLRADPSA